MSNLTSPRALWFKGLLFVVLGIMASTLLIVRMPDVTSLTLFLISIWAFCRAYYFAFYVIEHYVDPAFRFAGIIDFVRYAVLGKTADRCDPK
ncbi:hypothetical protein [Aureliella helgolandensis]|uniref:Uncharacterized protein n=1 Tax=Aureliella helgolandensis TaxID=2527968 RepID=A0A518G940_9BACT|nr:hypothetical protein [Aureliella helgolandensis]QDV25101.1 hypothetical protein Q31a_34240 [Aureliella helgolandensis]